jgi:hypothetical protein
MDLPSVIRPNIGDLAAFQCHLVFALAFALDRRGLLDRFELADELEHTVDSVKTGAARDLVRVVITGLRADREPPAPDLKVIDGGKS